MNCIKIYHIYVLQLLSEFILVAVASAIVIFEYNRSAQKEEKKVMEIEQEKSELRERVQDLEFAVEKQSTQLKELTRLAIAIRDDLQKSLLPKQNKKGFFSKKDEEQVQSVPPIPSELMDVFEKDNFIRKSPHADCSEVNDKINNVKENNIQNVCFFQNELNTISKRQHLSWQYCPFEDSENAKSLEVIPGTITTIVLEHLKYSDLQLIDV